MQTKVYQGYEYTQGPDGKWHRGQPVAGGQSIQTKPADPTLPYDTRTAAANATVAEAKAQSAPSEAELKALQIEEQRLKNEEIRLAREGKTMKDEEALVRGNLNAVGEQVLTIEGLHRDYLKGGFPNWLAGRMPTSSNSQFETAGSQLLDVGQAAFRVPGSGDQNQSELTFKLDAYLPEPTDTDKTIQQKLDYIKLRTNEQRKALGMPPIDWGAAAAPPPSGPDKSTQYITNPDTRGGAVTTSSNGMRSVEDPVLKGAAGRIGQMVADEASDQEILDLMARAGLNPGDTNIGTVLQYRRTPEYKAWKQQNPGRPYPIGDSFWTKEVPLTATENLFNSAAQSPVGAYAISAGDAVTGGRLDNIVGGMGGNQELANIGKAAVRAENPLSSFMGDVTGAGLDQALLGKLRWAGKMFRGGPRGMFANNAAYGGFQGSGENDADPLTGAVLGATVNAATDLGASGAVRAIGAGARGVRDGSARLLSDKGVPLTIGQMARTSNSLPMQTVAGLEDRMAGLPVIGDAINSARRRGTEGANRAAFNDGMAPVGGTTDRLGAAAIDDVQAATQQGYADALDGVTLTRDAPFDADFGAVRASAATIPVHGDLIASTLDKNVAPFMKAGGMTGRDFQSAIQALREEAAAYSGVPGGSAATDIFRQAEAALTGMVQRQAPDRLPKFNAANEAYRNQQILQTAVNGGKDEMFTGRQLERASISNTKRFGGLNVASSSGRPFYELGRAMDEVLPSDVPDSGTAGRIALPMVGAAIGSGMGFYNAQDGEGLSGGMEGLARGALLTGALMSPYSRLGQRGIQSLAIPSQARIDAVDRLMAGPRTKAILRAAPRVSGMFASGAARDYLFQDELP